MAEKRRPLHDFAIASPRSPMLRPDAVGLEDVMRDVQMESVHPLRLRLLLEIERTGSISAAAETCGIGQPSASTHIRMLEAATGRRLVLRTGRGSSLTVAGKVVASHAARVLSTLDSMRRTLDALDARSGGELILAASLMPSAVLIPEILRQFSSRYPGVSVRLRTASSEAVVREIGRGSADLGIAGEVPHIDSVVRSRLLVDELVGIGPRDLLTVDGGGVSLEELARHSLLVGGEGSSTRMVTERSLARADYRPVRVWVFDSYEAIKRAVLDGLGVSFVSRLLVRNEIERGELTAFHVSGMEPMERPLYTVKSTAADLTPEGAAFMTMLVNARWPGTQTAAATDLPHALSEQDMAPIAISDRFGRSYR